VSIKKIGKTWTVRRNIRDASATSSGIKRDCYVCIYYNVNITIFPPSQGTEILKQQIIQYYFKIISIRNKIESVSKQL
jgi:hypothetical protein